MLFGLSNTPARFQNYITKLFAKKLDIFIIIYLDDIQVFIEGSGQPYIETMQ